ncbi:MAG: glycosyltransferase family 1 protein [Ignavibacteriales bacterium]|nr:glycosyltransferase family 1 protein [Ignavibacteriales bacterium]MCB9220143.1 glycosyltransferase family 1 protein [Ignavibacteriales bacterium]
MKITILAVGTRGDIQPCVSLAMGLKRLNVKVVLATHSEYQNLVTSNNIDYAELPGNPANEWSENNEKFNFSEKMKHYGKKWLNESLEICKDTDAIVYTSLFFFGNHLAEKLKVPYFLVYFEPNITTAKFPSPYLGTEKTFNGKINKFTHNFAYYSFWLKIRKTINTLRNEELDLPPSPFWGYFSQRQRNSIKYLCCFSSNLVKKPTDWGENIFLSGYWFLTKEKQIIPDKELEKFLDTEKPVYFDFGSFSHEALRSKVRIIIEDLIKSGEKLLIDPGKIDITEYNFSDNTKIINSSIPHEWILPKVKAIITHGGVGAVHAAMKAGTPTIPVTLFPAQYFWGNLVYNLQLGAKPIRIRNLVAGNILDSIKYIDDNQKIRENLAKISAATSSEKSVDNASRFILNNI